MQLDWGRVGSHCSSSRTGAKYLTIVDARLNPGKVHDFNKHVDQEEVIMVIAGHVEQWLETERRVLGPGDSVFIPPNTVHASFNIGVGEAQIIAMFGPSVGEGGLETVDVATEKPWNTLRKIT